MPRANCRCGQSLEVPRDGADRIVCPQCGAKIRVRRSSTPSAGASADDGFIRFACPCGRRLKVAALDGRAGVAQCRCPDCGRVVNVPEKSITSDPETPTTELSPADMTMLQEWTQRFSAPAGRPTSTVDYPPSSPAPAPAPPPRKVETGMRLCTQCGKPIHLGADECAFCGVAAPRR